MKTDWKNVCERAVKTFVEAFIPALTAALAGADLTDMDTLPRVLVALAISAAATGISAVWNGVIEPLLKGKTEEKVETAIDHEDGDEENPTE